MLCRCWVDRGFKKCHSKIDQHEKAFDLAHLCFMVGFQDGDEELMFLLGPDDAVHRNDLGSIISCESPLGKAIRGRRKNEEVKFNLSKSASQRVKIFDILEGEF